VAVKRTPLQEAQANYDQTVADLQAAEGAVAAVDAKMVAGTKVTVQEYRDARESYDFFAKQLEGMERRLTQEKEAHSIERASALLDEVKTNTPDSASEVVEAWETARDALSTLIAKTEEFNAQRAGYMSRTEEFKSLDGQPSKALRHVLSQVAIRCEMFSPVALSAEVLVQCTERHLRTEEDRIAAQALRAIKPAPHYTLQLVQGMAGKGTDGAKDSGVPVTQQEKAKYVSKREAGASPAEAAKAIGRAEGESA
jgi:hypothetical protein